MSNSIHLTVVNPETGEPAALSETASWAYPYKFYVQSPKELSLRLGFECGITDGDDVSFSSSRKDQDKWRYEAVYRFPYSMLGQSATIRVLAFDESTQEIELITEITVKVKNILPAQPGMEFFAE